MKATQTQTKGREPRQPRRSYTSTISRILNLGRSSDTNRAPALYTWRF